MSHTRHIDHSSRRTRTSTQLGEQLEMRLLMAADIFCSSELVVAAADFTPPVVDEESIATASPTLIFPDVPDVGSADNWNLNAVRAPEAWTQGFTGQGVVVAIVDSGVDGANSALLGQIWSNVDEIAGNGRDDDSNGFVDDMTGWDFVAGDNHPDDESGHGTHIAGIVAAHENGSDVLGVAPDAKIMPIRVLDNQNTGTNSNIAAGIRYAADSGADVINLSIGGSQNAGIQAAIEYALARDVLVVAAAGNDAAQSPTYPAAFSATFPNTISVGAYRQAGSLGSFSNDVGASGAVQVDAPGISILSSFIGRRTMYMSGTSMATPHVAGVAALALSANSQLSAAELRNLIVDGADQSIAGSDSRGAVNAARTVAAAAALRDVHPPETPRRAVPSEINRVPVATPRSAPAIAVRVSIQRATPNRDTALIALRPSPVNEATQQFAWAANVWREFFEDDSDVDVWLERAFVYRGTRPLLLGEWPRLNRAVRL